MNMKKILLVAFALTLFLFKVNAQIENPVEWTYSAKKISNKQYEVHLTATIEGKWHVYAQDAGEGPEPTSFVFNKNPLIKLIGKVNEVGKLETSFDKNFNSTLKFYNKKVDFVQKISLKSSASTVLKGTITYMVCNDNKCLPPKDVPFSIKIDSK
jgi:thiol:disulfide interchange protein DsbD